MQCKAGDLIEVIDSRYSKYPIHGEVIDLDANNPLEYGQAKIRVDGPALSSPEIWVKLRKWRPL